MVARHRPTYEVYSELQRAFDHFNGALFGDKLPPCLIVLQRNKKRSYGHFSHERYERRTGEKTDEIAMNPGYFGVRPVEVSLSTLVHEMVHAWQFHFGKPGRRGYHNREWADRMESVGLIPSHNGEPGGRRVGEKCTHYIEQHGRFDRACAELMTHAFTLSWLDRFPPAMPSAAPDGGGSAPTTRVVVAGEPDLSLRVKYRCPKCGAQVWGKPGLTSLLHGGDCGGAAFAPA